MRTWIKQRHFFVNGPRVEPNLWRSNADPAESVPAAAMAQWLRSYAVEPKDAASVPAAVAAFRVETTENTHVSRFRRRLKAKLIRRVFLHYTARLIAQVYRMP